MSFRVRLEAEARAAGFVSVGVCAPDAIPKAPGQLASFLDAEYHGQMTWMGERSTWRGNPAALWPEARSVVMLAHSYSPGHDPLNDLNRPEHGAISVYAQGGDYHDVVKKALKRVARWMVAEGDCEVKVFVDTAPVMEKPLAQAAGLGWQGKHTNLLSRDFGNWVFLGAIFTTLNMEPDAPEAEHCGSCRKCLDICPTDAFPAPFQLDARRCISYLTIEHRGPVDEGLRPALGNRIYGCDDCLAVCPWNKFAVEASDLRYHGPHRAPDLGELAMLDDTAFRARFSGSPIKRIGRDRMVRNVCYAIGNSRSDRLKSVVQGLCEDPDAGVSNAARWAVERI